MKERITDLVEPVQFKSAFTVKSILFGFLAICFICSFAPFNEDHLKQSLMVGNHFPISAFFFVLVLALVWNPFWGLLWKRMVLTSRELVAVLGLSLTSCFVPTSGLFRYFHRMLILPRYYLPIEKSGMWAKYKVLDYLPQKLFPLGDGVNDEKAYEEIYMGFVDGSGSNSILPWDLPWDAWLPPLIYWGPMIVFFIATTLGLSLIVHRQWAHHEQLSYPLANIATSLFKKTEERNSLSDIFHSRLFWGGALTVFIIHLIRMGHVWHPKSIPDIQLNWSSWSGFRYLFPVTAESGTFYVETGKLYFTIVGIAYFLSSEIGLTMGISQILLCIVGAEFYLTFGKPIASPDLQLARGGAYVGYALILLYTGWSYYKAVFLKAFGIGGKADETERDAVWAARVFLLGFAGMISMFVIMGLDWVIAILFSMLTMTLFLVFSRLICETGIPFLQADWFPGTLLAKIMGFGAIGGGPLVFTYYVGRILTQDPRECLMPYVSTSLKVADNDNISLTRMLKWVFIGLMLALVVGFSAKLWQIYNYGAAEDSFAFKSQPMTTFNEAVRGLTYLTETGQLEKANAASGLSKLSMISFDGHVMTYFLGGILLVILCSSTRFRFSSWPIHPAIFMVWGTYPIQCTAWSFLIGWAIKEMVVRFGGGKVYQNLKPLFIGLIIGELAAGGLGIIIGSGYYFYHYMMYGVGLKPQPYIILPS